MAPQLQHHCHDQICVSGLSVRTVIGILDDERQRRQELLIHLLLDTDVESAAQKDQIEAALDYDSLTRRVIEFVEGSKFYLIETLAERIAELLLTEFSSPRVTVSIEKPGALRYAENVGVSITRPRLSTSTDPAS